MAGKLILLKATLDSLSIYWSKFLVMPSSLKKKIDIIRIEFLWCKIKIYLISWNTVTQVRDMEVWESPIYSTVSSQC